MPYTSKVLDGASPCQRIVNAIITRFVDDAADAATIAAREGGLYIRIYREDAVVYEKSYRRVNDYIMENVGYRLEIMAAAQGLPVPTRFLVRHNERNYRVHFAVSARLIRITAVSTEADS